VIDLRLGDCFAINGLPSLADRSVDVIITDPPFDQRTHRAGVEVGPRVEGKRSVAGELPFPPLDAAKLVELAQHFVRVTRSWICAPIPGRRCRAIVLRRPPTSWSSPTPRQAG